MQFLADDDKVVLSLPPDVHCTRIRRACRDEHGRGVHGPRPADRGTRCVPQGPVGGYGSAGGALSRSVALEGGGSADCTTRNSTLSSAYTSAMFSETRYALNGDLRVAYRASREGERDIVFIPHWFTCCEILPELPSIQGWVEAMTSLGRLIFFDQPGTGASDPVRRAPCRPWSNGPTASPRCSTISRVAKRSSSRSTARSRRRRCSRQHIRPAPPRWSCSRATRIRWLNVLTESLLRNRRCHHRHVGDREVPAFSNPDMPWNDEIRATWARHERLAASPGTLALMMPLLTEVDVRAVLPTIRVPTLVVQHADDRFPASEWGKYVADHIPGAKYVELPGRNMYHFVEPWRESFQQIAEFLTGRAGRRGRRSGPRHGAVHRHRGLDTPGRRDRRP